MTKRWIIAAVGIVSLVVLALLLLIMARKAHRGDKTLRVADNVDVLPEPPRKVIFLGVDGADWQIINPLIDEGKLPNFAKIVEGGATGDLQSMLPILSPLIWTTMATGKLPEEHGILDFTVRDPKTGTMVPISRLQRRVDAFWNMLTDADRTVDVIGWLATYPAETINGVMVTDKMGYLAFASAGEAEDHPPGTVSPQGRYDEVASLMVSSDDVTYGEIARIIHIDEQTFRENKTGSFDPNNPVANLILIYSTVQTFRNIALHLYDEDRPDLLAVYFEFLDAVCHLFMPYAPPRQAGIDEELYRRYRDAVDEAYIIQDEIIGEYLERLDDNTVVVIASDHGFKSGSERLTSSAEIAGGHAAEWHRLQGIVCLYGNGIKPGHRIADASVRDITLTMLALQGFPRPKDMPGKALVDAFEPSLINALMRGSVTTLQRERSLEDMEDGAAGELDEAALKKLEALGYLTPESPDALNNLGQRYRNQRQYDKAIEAFEKSLALRPNSSSTLDNLGLCYALMKRFGEAEDCFLQSLSVRPGNTHAMNNLASMYLHTGRLEDARRHAEQALEVEPNYLRGRITLGAIYMQLGETELAEREFEKALEIDPDNQAAIENLQKLRSQLE
jgi:tetratricopeptide (TPR) repeat protein